MTTYPTNTYKTHYAFTLVELLTVIAIIGILAAIIIPTVGKVREQGRITQCRSNLRQHALAMALYADDHRGFYPAIKNDTYPSPSFEGNNLYDKLLQCNYLPADRNIYRCPSLEFPPPVDKQIQLGYLGINPTLCPDPGATAGRSIVRRRVSDIENPSRTAILIEVITNTLFVRGNNGAESTNSNWGIARDIVANVRHTGNHQKTKWYNVAYADAHVRFIDIRKVGVGETGSDEFWGINLPQYSE